MLFHARKANTPPELTVNSVYSKRAKKETQDGMPFKAYISA